MSYKIRTKIRKPRKIRRTQGIKKGDRVRTARPVPFRGTYGGVVKGRHVVNTKYKGKPVQVRTTTKPKKIKQK